MAFNTAYTLEKAVWWQSKAVKILESIAYTVFCSFIKSDMLQTYLPPGPPHPYFTPDYLKEHYFVCWHCTDSEVMNLQN